MRGMPLSTLYVHSTAPVHSVCDTFCTGYSCQSVRRRATTEDRGQASGGHTWEGAQVCYVSGTAHNSGVSDSETQRPAFLPRLFLCSVAMVTWDPLSDWLFRAPIIAYSYLTHRVLSEKLFCFSLRVSGRNTTTRAHCTGFTLTCWSGSVVAIPPHICFDSILATPDTTNILDHGSGFWPWPRGWESPG